MADLDTWLAAIVEATRVKLQLERELSSVLEYRADQWRAMRRDGMSIPDIVAAQTEACRRAGLPVDRKLGLGKDSVLRALSQNY